MKRLFAVGNRYAAQSDWKDFALTKICLCAMGILIGLRVSDAVSEDKKKTVEGVSCIAFWGTYAVLMAKVCKVIHEMVRE